MPLLPLGFEALALILNVLRNFGFVSGDLMRILPTLLLFCSVPLGCPAEQHPAFGVVLQVDGGHRSMRVSCHEIPGYMDAMAMEFPVRNAKDLDGLQPGTLIDFTLVVEKASVYAAGIRIHQFQRTDPEPMAVRQLNLLDGLVGSGSDAAKMLEIGQRVPDFSLVDQSSQSVSLSSFTGKVVGIAFMYTRCPLPNYCFRLSNNFGMVRKRFPDHLGRDLILLNITFDPVHDQPEVLAEYSRNWNAAGVQGWHFLTGPVLEVQKVCHEFGMNFWQDEGLITHALHTVILDREGKIVANLEGNEFTAQQLATFSNPCCR
jgi:protein SCO1/2